MQIIIVLLPFLSIAALAAFLYYVVLWFLERRDRAEHYCELPTLDGVNYGAEWRCPQCGAAYVKVEYDDDSAYWERDE